MEGAIAIIGMDCKFPEANSLEEFWEILKNKKYVVKDSIEKERKESYVNKAFYLDDIDKFDADFFHISKRDAKFMDPQQRLFLESAWKAMENAGYNVDKLEQKVGVFVGSGISTYLMSNILPYLIRNGEDYNKLLAQIIHGNSGDYLSSRVSFNMNFTGPSVTVQTACSSALTAVHLACRSLLMYECDMALCGGSSVNANQGHAYKYVKGEIYSKSGICSPFSEQADGTIFSGGVGTLVLKRYEDAVEEGDYIYAVIRGSGINNDGADKMSYTAPSVKGQLSVILDAFAFADIPLESISYIETHGTGTDIGDQIEIAALKQVFGQCKKEDKIFLGAVKGNIGHSIAASGIAGLIKTILCLNKGYLCPTVNCSQVNKKLKIENSPFDIVREYKKWESKDGEVLRASVSSFGMGGANAHVILEEYKNEKVKESEPSNSVCVLKLSAHSKISLEAMKKELYKFLSDNKVNDDTLMYIYNMQRKEFSTRELFYYRNKQELLDKLFGDVKKYTKDETYEEIKSKWESGMEIDFSQWIHKDNICKQPLPGYVFQHESYWIDGEFLNNETFVSDEEKKNLDIESYMGQIWKEYLGIDDEDIDKDFFEVGGSSIVAYQLISEVEEKFGIEIDVIDLMEEPTLDFICKAIRERLGN